MDNKMEHDKEHGPKFIWLSKRSLFMFIAEDLIGAIGMFKALASGCFPMQTLKPNMDSSC